MQKFIENQIPKRPYRIFHILQKDYEDYKKTVYLSEFQKTSF